MSNTYLPSAGQRMSNKILKGVTSRISGLGSIRMSQTALNAVPPSKASYDSLEGVPEPDALSVVEEERKPKLELRAWIVLAIVVLVRVMVQS